MTDMTLSVITSALMRVVDKRGISIIKDVDGNIVKQVSKTRLILPVTALALHLAMLGMRIPGLMGYQR